MHVWWLTGSRPPWQLRPTTLGQGDLLITGRTGSLPCAKSLDFRVSQTRFASWPLLPRSS